MTDKKPAPEDLRMPKRAFDIIMRKALKVKPLPKTPKASQPKSPQAER